MNQEIRAFQSAVHTLDMMPLDDDPVVNELLIRLLPKAKATRVLRPAQRRYPRKTN